MGRTIVETGTPGWFLDPETNKKTRKQDGDEVISQEEALARATGADSNGSDPVPTQSVTETVKQAVASEESEVVVSDTGKILRGKLTVVRCQHPIKDPETGRKRKCGAERIVKVQDEFQTVRCVPHQEEHRREIRKQKAKAKRAAAKAAAKS